MSVIDVGGRAAMGYYDSWDSANNELDAMKKLLDEEGHNFIQMHKASDEEQERQDDLAAELFDAEPPAFHFVTVELGEFLRLSDEERMMWNALGINPEQKVSTFDMADLLREFIEQAKTMNWFTLSLCQKILEQC